MKRSKSALPQKMKKDARCAAGKSNKKGNKNAQLRDPWPLDNQSTTERPHTERNRFEERLTKIQQGFDDLERNLNLDRVNKTASPRAKCDSPA